MDYLWDDIKYWLEDNWQKALVLVGVFVIVALGIKMIIDEQNEGVPQNNIEVLERLITDSEDIKGALSLLDEQVTNYPDTKYPYYEIDLYVKKPFIERSELETVLETYIENLKILLSQEDRQLKAVRFKLYDRKVLWDLGLEPKGVYEYRWAYDQVKDDQIYATTGGTETESVYEAAWRLTTTYKGKPDYKKYALEGNYHHLSYKNGAEPLTDQEFEWYLKYDKYRLFGNPTRVYIEWELGGSSMDSGNAIIGNQFRDFTRRLQSVGDKIEYYNYPDGVRQDLIITRPQFLYYNDVGKVALDDIDARSKLLAYDPQKYTRVIERWLETQAQEQVRKANNPNAELEDSSDEVQVSDEDVEVYSSEPLEEIELDDVNDINDGPTQDDTLESTESEEALDYDTDVG